MYSALERNASPFNCSSGVSIARPGWSSGTGPPVYFFSRVAVTGRNAPEERPGRRLISARSEDLLSGRVEGPWQVFAPALLGSVARAREPVPFRPTRLI